ncbi:MAG: 3-phosphoshikimate 1-carboxyvinyltransferase, partial [Spirochaetes bacterium]|nr:3-phosphoshikimate 1-carboxyvinyltransferase [Spirochaetota bacterium]
IKGGKLKGARIDMNSTPDALPIMAVVACFADGQTELYNVSQARIKETDRIRVMSTELAKLGADIEEKEDGLVIKKSLLKGHSVSGHSDHRVVMALTVAGLMARGETIIDTAEAVNITFPDFFDLIKACHGDITLLD